MMNGKYKSIIALVYLCSVLFIVLFIITMSFSLLGYWTGGGYDILSFITDKLFSYFKVGLSGVLIGFILWFFYYRKF